MTLMMTLLMSLMLRYYPPFHGEYHLSPGARQKGHKRIILLSLECRLELNIRVKF